MSIVNTIVSKISLAGYYGKIVTVRWDASARKWAIVEKKGKAHKPVKHFTKAIITNPEFSTELSPDSNGCSSTGHIGIVTGTLTKGSSSYPAEAKAFSFKNDLFVDGASGYRISKAKSCWLFADRRAMYL